MFGTIDGIVITAVLSIAGAAVILMWCFIIATHFENDADELERHKKQVKRYKNRLKYGRKKK